MSYYVYAYLREDRFSPYYVGKGIRGRINDKNNHSVPLPPLERRVKIKENLTEEEAFLLEKLYVLMFGRKDLGTGVLRNRTDGGEGASGHKQTAEHRANASRARKGKPTKRRGGTLTEEHKRNISEGLLRHAGRTEEESKERRKETLSSYSKKNRARINVQRNARLKEQRRLAKLNKLD